MKKLLIGMLIGICLPFLAGYLFVRFGGMPVATKGPPLPFERKIAGMALHAAIAPEAGRPSPIPANDANLLAGAKVYVEQCAVCHGLPDSTRTPVGKGLYPPPPQLFMDGEDVTDDPVGETFWKAKNGIRLTGMPGFGGSLTDTQLWQVSLLLHAKKTPPAVQDALAAKKP